jgi:dUTP pyrophosphatase
MYLQYYKIYDDVASPAFATKDSACFDLSAYLPLNIPVKIYDKMNNVIHRNPVNTGTPTLIINPWERAMIPTGLILNIPLGYSVRLHVRSSMIKKGLDLANNEGVVDSDYVDPVFMVIRNLSGETASIDHNQRVCQAEVVTSLQYSLDETKIKPIWKSDRTGGFGSTGR